MWFLQLYNKIWNHSVPPKKNVRTAQHSSKYLVLCQVHALNPNKPGLVLVCLVSWWESAPFAGTTIIAFMHLPWWFQACDEQNVVSCHLTSTMIQRDLWDLVYPSLFNKNTKFHKDCMGTAYDLLTLKRNCVHFIICICYIELRSCMCNGEIK